MSKSQTITKSLLLLVLVLVVCSASLVLCANEAETTSTTTETTLSNNNKNQMTENDLKILRDFTKLSRKKLMKQLGNQFAHHKTIEAGR